ncbi:MAG TPA: threonine/serine dehydratase, partial [Gemmatimonadaceae bacterium]
MAPQTVTTELVSAGAIIAAAEILRPVAVRTPLLRAPWLSEELGVPVSLKPEMLQRSGAFKFRGAYTFVAGLSGTERARGVVAPSSGNHAQAVALAARLFGVRATVVMPTTVTPAKRAGAERLGARIELAGTTTKDRMDRAVEICEAEGATLVPPFDDARIIAGQGTVGLEIVEDLPLVGTVLVPVGGGGLSAGVAAAVKQLRPQARVIGVEPAGAAKLTAARAAGEPVTMTSTASIADGLMSIRIGAIPFVHHEAFMDDVVTVDDAAIVRAMRNLLDRAKVVAEPSGAITVAALQEGRVSVSGETVAIL